MNIAVKWGLILGVVVGVLGFVFGIAGLHTSPIMAMVFVGLAVLINIAVVIFALREAAATASWGAQIANGLVLGLVGAVIIFASSWLMTGVVFPEYYEEMRLSYLDFFENAGMTEAQIDEQMLALEAVTPVSGARQGAIGTVITSLVVAAIGGIFWRRK